MKDILKNLYQRYKPFFNGVLTLLGVIAIFDWIIFPGLTSSNTIINILSFILMIIVIFVTVAIWFNCLKPKKSELTEDEEIKE